MPILHGVEHHVPKERECRCGHTSRAELFHYVEDELLVFKSVCSRKNCKWTGFQFAGKPAAIEDFLARMRVDK